MNVLAFDTCFGAVSVAVRWQGGRGEQLLREAYEARTTGHAERLFPMLSEVMDGAGLAFSAIERIAVTLGPGSFTGVRVGIAAARALALATGKPVVGMTSLAAMARRALVLLEGGGAGRPLAVAVDARRDMVYLQLFGDHGRETGEAMLVTPAQAARAIGPAPVLVLGSGAPAVAAAVAAAGREAEARLIDLEPHARALALAAHELAPLDPVKPLYLRAPDAKPQGDKSLPRALP
jgi:tRNA threonylcarbamoyladenosine biosynthesis protein TsaB